jgi:hypothetical protein
MIKVFNILLLLSFFLSNNFGQILTISDNGKRLLKNGKPFFYLADTAWELIHRSTREEAELYLRDRADKGFTVIQTVILAERNGLRTPNSYGNLPLNNFNPLDLNEKYFEHVDWIIKRANELKLVIALLPTWGDKWNQRWGDGPVIFTNPKIARDFGYLISTRYKNDENIIWILGGDRDPEEKIHLEIIDAMAEGLRKGDNGNHLISFHPTGDASSSKWFHKKSWLDFNMLQSGHWKLHKEVYDSINADYNLTPTKPCLNGEPQYEDILIRFSTENQRFDDYDVRESAYWSVLAGACGHTYGNNNIWQMWLPGREAAINADIPWNIAMHHRGAKQMGFLRKVFESRPFTNLIPDQKILTNYIGHDIKNIRAARDYDSSYAIIYLPTGNSTRINLQYFKVDLLSGYWFNPREGDSKRIHEFINTKKEMDFVPPSSGYQTDWVLILDDHKKNYPDPASITFEMKN